MAYVSDEFISETEGQLRNRFSPVAEIFVTGPGLGQTDECSVTVAFTDSKKRQHHNEFSFVPGNRSVHTVSTDLIRDITNWMNEVKG